MNILFLSIGRLENLLIKSLYPDLLRKFKDEGHSVYVVSPRERRLGLNTELCETYGIHTLRVRIGNITKTNLVEKGISTIVLERVFLKEINKYFKNIKFDLVLYSTPPITFEKIVHYIKKRDGAVSYLMLKDIFPQNAVDLKMFSKKSVIYKYFRAKEKRLYAQSDMIGCMSQANVEYILQHNPEISPSKVEVCPNSIEVQEVNISKKEQEVIRRKYDIPNDKMVFVYGGNLGKPQGIDFLIECLKSQRENVDAYFLIIGSGTEYKKLEQYYKDSGQKNLKVMSALPKEDYDMMIWACDVGMIFLDKRFTIPNFPSRLLSYMQAKLPILAVTDINTDVGKVIVNGGFGWWCEAGNIEDFCSTLCRLPYEDTKLAGERAYDYLLKTYTVQDTYKIIMEHFI